MILIHKTVPFQVKNLIKDRMGRYLIIQGSLLSENVNLVNLYGPNIDDHNFFVDLFLTLSCLTGQHIIAGDFNYTLNPSIDRSTGIDQTHTGCRMTINHFTKELKLLDIWRELKPQVRAHSCYSNIYKTFSRIDYFLIFAQLRSKIQNCFDDNIVIKNQHYTNNCMCKMGGI